MRRLNILIWHVHGSYLNTLARLDHNWYLPVKPGRPEGYGGRGPTFNLPEHVREVPAERVRDLELDLVIYQTSRNYLEDAPEILTVHQRSLPRIYLEHNTPRPHASDTQHPIDDPSMLLVHVTHYNNLMWNNGRMPTVVVEHSVAIDDSVRYSGDIARGITVVNGMQKRPRIAGYDLFLQARERVPLDVAGMQSEAFGGLGDIPYRDLHSRTARYRFLFSPMRYTSMPLAVIEAMTIGMPVVALATTELPTVIRNGHSGFVSCDIDELITNMHWLLRHPDEARAMGDKAQAVARRRFGLDRFAGAWNAAFEHAISLSPPSNGSGVHHHGSGAESSQGDLALQASSSVERGRHV